MSEAEKLAITSPWGNAPIYYKIKTLSTMKDAIQLYESGHPCGTVIAAGYQEEGRGRFPGRLWKSAPGKNLLFTLLLYRVFSFPPQRLPVLVGLALSLAIEDLFKVKTQVKWPNDLLYKDKKIAGILCESHGEVYLIGMGVNCNQERFPKELNDTACSLTQILRRQVENFHILKRILFFIKRSISDTQWKGKLFKRLYGLGEEIEVQQDEEFKGVLKGVADDGALLVQPENSSDILSIVSGAIRKI